MSHGYHFFNLLKAETCYKIYKKIFQVIIKTQDLFIVYNKQFSKQYKYYNPQYVFQYLDKVLDSSFFW